MSCGAFQERLGPLLDGELDAAALVSLEQHIETCRACRVELERLRSAIVAVAAAEDAPVADVPREVLWRAIEARLDDAGSTTATTDARERSGTIRFRRWKSLASAALVFLAVGLGWVVMSAPWSVPAHAAQIDFRPLLEQAGDDIKAGIDALIAAHGGQTITRGEASKRMTIRVHAADKLPSDLTLRSMYLINLGRSHQSLGFHYEGPRGHLLLLQCPAGVEKQYGGNECMACQLGGDDGHITRVGSLRLAHFDSENVCVCVVSTLDETTDLPAALDAVKIDF